MATYAPTAASDYVSYIGYMVDLNTMIIAISNTGLQWAT